MRRGPIGDLDLLRGSVLGGDNARDIITGTGSSKHFNEPIGKESSLGDFVSDTGLKLVLTKSSSKGARGETV